jgi:hypothetical protein
MVHFELTRRHLVPALAAAGDEDRFSIDGVPERADLLPVSQVGRLLVAFRLPATVLFVLVVPIAFLTILHETLSSSTGERTLSDPVVEPKKR